MPEDLSSFPTPLVQLSRFAPANRVFLKPEYLQPTGSVFDRIARPLLDARAEELRASGTAIVAGSGALCLSFAAQAPLESVELVAVCPSSTLPEHKKLLEGHRVTVIFSDPSLGLRGAHARALEETARRRGVLLCSPLESAGAQRIFAASVGAELAEACTGIEGLGDGAVGVVAPVGSGALISGVAQALEKSGRRVVVLGTVRARSERDSSVQDGIVAEDEAAHVRAVELVAVADRDAFAARVEAARSEGVLVGLASAAALHAARIRAGAGDLRAMIAIAVDAGDRYFSVDHHLRSLLGSGEVAAR